MLTREQLERDAASLRRTLARGCGLPAARPLAEAVLRQYERRLGILYRDLCESGCSAPVITDEPVPPLCSTCAARMLP